MPLLFQLEDSAIWRSSTKILPRDKYMAKVRAALEALDGTDCLLIARSNADPADPEQMKEGCERLQEAIDLGKERGMYVLAMMVMDRQCRAWLRDGQARHRPENVR